MSLKPTIQTAAWGITSFLDSAIELLETDEPSTTLRLYFYAATRNGWTRISEAISTWQNNRPGRTVQAYIGTDHAITDPEALQLMEDSDIEVYMLANYRGTFHPKLFWFTGGGEDCVLAGSNNLTEDGLANNIEFATLARLEGPCLDLNRWHDAVLNASERLSQQLLDSYRKEKEDFGKARASKGLGGTFTWSRRKLGLAVPPVPGIGQVARGDLILEVMPRETSSEGRQVQIPMAIAQTFFGLGGNRGDAITISLTNAQTSEIRQLTLTHNQNSTSRLSIRELEYRSRPCILLFRRIRARRFEFEIVRLSIEPVRYQNLLQRCPQLPSRRRWTVTAR